MQMFIPNLVDKIFQIYSFLIIIRVFLTWIPTLDWDAQPIKALREITDVYLDVFKRLVPPIGNIDFSPIIALIALQLLAKMVVLFLMHL